MANVKKGQTVRAPQWWKHLRAWKRVFWKRQRKADKKRALTEIFDAGENGDNRHRNATDANGQGLLEVRQLCADIGSHDGKVAFNVSNVAFCGNSLTQRVFGRFGISACVFLRDAGLGQAVHVPQFVEQQLGIGHAGNFSARFAHTQWVRL